VKIHTIHEAKTNLSQLIRKACEGEEVIIARGDKPVVKLVPVGEPTTDRVPGGFEGQISWTEDAFDPLTDEEMRELGFE
jgi:prevent-host-death family protein